MTAGEKSALRFLIKSNAVLVAKYSEMWNVKFNGAEKAYSNFADCTIFLEVGIKYQFALWKAKCGCKNNRGLQKSVPTQL